MRRNTRNSWEQFSLSHKKMQHGTLPMYHGTLSMYHGTSAVYHGTFSYGIVVVYIITINC